MLLECDGTSFSAQSRVYPIRLGQVDDVQCMLLLETAAQRMTASARPLSRFVHVDVAQWLVTR